MPANWWVFYVPGDADHWQDAQYVASVADTEDSSEDGGWWTCNEATEEGDRALLYAKAPISAIVGILEATSPAIKQHHEFSGHPWVCDFRCITVFDEPIPFRAMREDAQLRQHWGLIRGNISGSGIVVAKASLTDVTTGEYRSGIVSSMSGTITSVVRDGEQVPGMAPEVQFKELLNTSYMAVNKARQLAIYAHYGSEPVGPYPSGIWATDNSGVLRLIVHNGQELEVAPGDRRTISYVWTYGHDTGLQDGHQSWFNEAGQIVFGARFTDHSEGIFVSNAVAVPEPSTILLCLLGFVALLVAARRSHRAC